MSISRSLSPIAFFLALLLASLTPQFSAAQSNGVTVEMSELDKSSFPTLTSVVKILDRNGIPVANLTPDRFLLQEDNRPVNAILQGFSDPNQAIAICIVLDTSDSMLRDNRLQNAKAAARALIDGLGPQDRACLVGFNGKVDINNPPVIDPTREVELTSDKNKLKSVLDSLQAVGGTALYDAAIKGTKLVSAAAVGARAVILLSDGVDCGNEKCGGSVSTPNRPIQVASELHVPIYTFGFGNETDAGYLRRIAEETGAVNVQQPDTKGLAQFLQNTTNQLKTRYRLQYTTTLQPDDKIHTVTLTVNTPRGVGQATTQFDLPQPVPVQVQMRFRSGDEFLPIRDGEPVRGNFIIAPGVRITDTNAISTTTFFVDGAPLFTAVKQPYEYAWDTCAAPQGEHQLAVQVMDTANRIGTATARVVTLSSGVICRVEGLSTVQRLGLGGFAALALVIVAILVLFTRRRPQPVAQEAVQPVFNDQMPPSLSNVGFPSSPAPFPSDTIFGSAPPASPPSLDKTQSISPRSIPSNDPSSFGENRASNKTLIISSKKPQANMAFLVMQEGDRPGRDYPLHAGVNSIGRAGDNDIVVNDERVGRKQAKIKLEDSTYYLLDLAATNPTKVNGVPQRDKYALQEQDRIEMGNTVFVFKQVTN